MILDVELYVIGSSVAKAGDLLLEPRVALWCIMPIDPLQNTSPYRPIRAGG